MKRLEKIAKKQLNDNEEGAEALIDKYVSSIEFYRKLEEKNISEANLDIQKALANVADSDSDEIIANIFQSMSKIDDAEDNLDVLDRLQTYLFEEIQERKDIKGFTKTKKS